MINEGFANMALAMFRELRRSKWCAGLAAWLQATEPVRCSALLPRLLQRLAVHRCPSSLAGRLRRGARRATSQRNSEAARFQWGWASSIGPSLVQYDFALNLRKIMWAPLVRKHERHCHTGCKRAEAGGGPRSACSVGIAPKGLSGSFPNSTCRLDHVGAIQNTPHNRIGSRNLSPASCGAGLRRALGRRFV